MFDKRLQAGVAHHNAGRLDEAEAVYRRVLANRPQHADALHLLGLIFHQRGDNVAAAPLLEQAIGSSPKNPTFHANLGLIYQSCNRIPEAIRELTEAVRLDARQPDAWNNLGTAQMALGQHDQALASFQHAISQRPNFALAYLNRAVTLHEQRRYDEAAAAYQLAVTYAPNEPRTLFRFALFLQELGRSADAVALYRRVIALVPTHFESYANLGNSLRELAQIEPAIVSYREALRLRPDMAECHLNLASGLLSTGLVDESLAESRIAINLKPQLEEAHTTQLLGLQYRLYPAAEVLEAHRQWARLFEKPSPPAIGALPVEPLATERAPGATSISVRASEAGFRRLRVGLISADFFDHPIAYFLEPLLAAHDRDRLELTCYSGVARPDEFTVRLQGQADRWREIRPLSHERVAALIAEDGIDILIDLAGHTTGSRLPALALKPAPVQISYLGYPSTTGLLAMDYRLTDGYADPPGLTEPQYVEKLIRLPRTLACYSPPSNAPEVGELPALRPDRAGSITFASFSSLAKIAPQTVSLWASTLQAVSGSRLAIMGRGADGVEFQHRMRSLFAAEGVDPARIELRPSAAIDKYLAFHNDVDIVLDTFPFNGHTTLCHALWMGVPVVSLAGDRFASRLGLSVLTNIGFSNLVAESPEGFVQIAAELAHNLQRLAELRRGLRRQMSQSPLLDARQFAVDFEQALRRISIGGV